MHTNNKEEDEQLTKKKMNTKTKKMNTTNKDEDEHN